MHRARRSRAAPACRSSGRPPQRWARARVVANPPAHGSQRLGRVRRGGHRPGRVRRRGGAVVPPHARRGRPGDVLRLARSWPAWCAARAPAARLYLLLAVGALFPLGYLIYALAVLEAGRDAGMALAERWVLTPLGSAAIVGLLGLAAALVRRRRAGGMTLPAADTWRAAAPRWVLLVGRAPASSSPRWAEPRWRVQARAGALGAGGDAGRGPRCTDWSACATWTSEPRRGAGEVRRRAPTLPPARRGHGARDHRGHDGGDHARALGRAPAGDVVARSPWAASATRRLPGLERDDPRVGDRAGQGRGRVARLDPLRRRGHRGHVAAHRRWRWGWRGAGEAGPPGAGPRPELAAAPAAAPSRGRLDGAGQRGLHELQADQVRAPGRQVRRRPPAVRGRRPPARHPSQAARCPRGSTPASGRRWPPATRGPPSGA